MVKAAKASKTTTKATKAAKKTAAASGKGKENATSKKKNARSNAGKGGTKKKSGGSSAGGEEAKKKSGGITKAEQKKIDVWWEQHADSLVKTAVEDCDHWKECDAKNAVQAYRQFLIVKREMKDWENELIPCLLVSAMVEYHAHNEDFDYQSDMKLLCGHDFGDNQLVVVGKDDDFDREKATFDAVKTRFGSECDDKLWNTLPICIVEVDGGMKWDPDKWIPANEDSCFIVHRQKEECLESVFEEYIEDGDPEPLSLSNFQFLLSRTKEVIDPNDTALGLRLTYSDSDVIFALYTYETLIEVKVKKKDLSGPHLFYAADQKKPFSKALQDLVKDDEGDETEYVFVFKGKRLYGFETPMSLQMKHFDIIDAIPSQDYKYQRCICCNIAEGNVLSSQCTGIC